MEPDARKQKVIRNINSFLNRLGEKQLRIILLVANMFAKIPQEKV